MFEFIKYIQPAYYYSLASQLSESVIPMEFVEKSEIKPYRDEFSARMDLTYLNLQSGVIPQIVEEKILSHILSLVCLLSKNNYVEKYFC